MIRKLFKNDGIEAVYGLDVFDRTSREWVFTGYRPEREARKAADAETRRGGRVHLWRDSSRKVG